MTTVLDCRGINVYAFPRDKLNMAAICLRDYDPVSARFLSKDPLGPHEGGDINPYRYAMNNPVNLVDPDGKCPAIPLVLGIAALLYPSRTDTPGQGQREREMVTDIGLAAIASFSAYRGAQIENVGKRFDPNQQALIDLAKQGQRTGLTQEQTYIMRQWANEYNVPMRTDPAHIGTQIEFPHSHIGPVNHIRIVP